MPDRPSSDKQTGWTRPNLPLGQILLRGRWPLIVMMLVAFVLGQGISALFIEDRITRLVFDIVGWSLLSVLAVWLGLAWIEKRERRHQANLSETLQRQQELNQQLQRANSHLALLSETNQQIAGSLKLDDILDAALVFPQRLIPAQAAALILTDATGPIETRTQGASTEELARWRQGFAVVSYVRNSAEPRLLQHFSGASDSVNAGGGAPTSCLVLPLHDGLAPVGWIELYLAQQTEMADDELALLDTIASEIAEAIIGARRRSHEERAIFELERAIAEERARIARDIHDGLAQSLAFVRMRVDLWQDWIEDEPDRLHNELTDLKQTLRAQIRELRRAIFALRPVHFDELGFVGGLRRYIVEFAGQQDWETHVALEGAPSALSLELEAVCFRIVQEALTNAAKHAAATEVTVKIDQIDRGLRLVVRDNGRGFDPADLPDSSYEHVGLRQMYERLAAVRGQLTLLSFPNEGTELRVWIPLLEQTESEMEHQQVDVQSERALQEREA